MQAIIYRKLSELLESYASNKRGRPEVWVRKLFQSLDWGERPTYSIADDPGNGFQLLVDKFPLINILVDNPQNIDSVYRALNRAYNQDIPWLVVTDFKSLSLFGSYWYSFPYDISSALALQIDQSQFLLESHQLELLSPQEAASSRLNELYGIYEGRKRRISLDLHLVQRMTSWRQLALSAIREPSAEADALIHRLINSLFLIRYIEDINSDNIYITLKSISDIEDDNLFSQNLILLLRQVADRTNYNIPTPQELRQLVYAPIRTLARQLYGYPEAGISYDFSAMSVDVLGRFYEEYLRWQVEPSQMPTYTMTLFEPPQYEFRNIRHDKGIYFTPRYIVDYITKNLVGRYFASHNDQNLPIVLDIACGSGTFLSAAVDIILELQPNLRQNPTSILESMVGLDNDPRAVEATRLNLTTKLLGVKTDINVPDLKLDCFDLLFNGPSGRQLQHILPNGTADIIIGNPPYIKYETLVQLYGAEELHARFETAEGRFDSYILFLEAAINLLADGGLGGFVVPNALLRGQAAANLRDWLTKKSQVLEVIDFLDQPVFQGVGTYVCLLLFRKRTRLIDEPQINVTVAKIYNITDTPSSQLAAVAVAQPELSDGIEVYRVAQPSGRGAWNLRSNVDTDLISFLETQCETAVRECFDVRQGIKTAADKIFVFEGTIVDKNFVEIHGENAIRLELGICLPLLRNRDMKRWYSKPKARIIYPYDNRNGNLLEWNIILRNFPNIANYLTSHRTALENRKSIASAPWYSLVRARTETFLARPTKLFISELSLRPLVCMSDANNVAIMGSTGGGSWLISRQDDDDTLALLAYLNSIVSEWYLRQICSLRQGGYILIEQSQLERIPIPSFLLDKNSFARSEIIRLTNGILDKVKNSSQSAESQWRRDVFRAEEQINTLILEAIGLNVGQASYMRDKILTSRPKS